jgi:hypothetical protein
MSNGRKPAAIQLCGIYLTKPNIYRIARRVCHVHPTPLSHNTVTKRSPFSTSFLASNTLLAKLALVSRLGGHTFQ